MTTIRIFLALILLTSLGAHFAIAQSSDPDGGGYVGTQICAACHTSQVEAWQGSHHALAWTMPSTETVVADFDGTSFRHQGVVTEFSRDGEAFVIDVTEVDGTKNTHTVHSVAGIEPLQQYLIETAPGRLQSFDVVWDADAQRWYHLYPDQDLPPEDGLHWTGPYKTWNGRCAECHATGFKKNYDAATQSYQSTQAEIGVGCEACHGPGAGHVNWAERSLSNPTPAPPGYGFSMDFAASGAEATIQQCAGCHSRREPMGDGNPLPGTAFDDAYTLALLRPGLYHADGQILDEVYVYGSFVQSKMYTKGVSCLNCHEAHSADLKVEGNGLCVQCHSLGGNPDFPSLPIKSYDDPAHHFHVPDSIGAQCVSCHMTERVYMGVDGRRDHSFRIPRPDLADKTRSPDACTDCHDNKDPAWAAAEIAKRHPDATQRAKPYGVVLAKGRDNPRAAQGDLIALANAQSRADLVRATALWLLSRGADEETAELVAPLLDDEAALVRAAAIGVQAAATPQDMTQRVLGLLNDPVKTVRIAAAKSLLNAPIARLPENNARQMRRAMREWQMSLQARLDFPETHMVLGGMALTTRNIPAAKSAFREVVRMDPQNIEGWVMLTRIAAAMEGEEATRIVLGEALSINPDDQSLLSLKASLSEP